MVDDDLSQRLWRQHARDEAWAHKRGDMYNEEADHWVGRVLDLEDQLAEARQED